jgi:hypothetical protein
MDHTLGRPLGRYPGLAGGSPGGAGHPEKGEPEDEEEKGGAGPEPPGSRDPASSGSREGPRRDGNVDHAEVRLGKPLFTGAPGLYASGEG